MSAEPVLIAGGGIGGLSAAIALARRGIAAQVLEAEPAFSESGAGVQIGPNGTHILRSWGLGEALEAKAARPAGIWIRDGISGSTLAKIPLGVEAESRYGAPYYVIERRALHRILLDEASRRPEIALATDFRVTDFAKDRGGVRAVSADGQERQGAALIGADGVHSRVRRRMFGAIPNHSGRNAWRATADSETSPLADNGFVNLWLGPGAHLVHYACGPRGPLNAVAITSGPPASPGWGSPGDERLLLQNFDGWAPEPLSILAGFANWMTWPLLAMAPLPCLARGLAVLLGDAAHPLMPFLASGAVMAIEDAAALAAAMAYAGNEPSAAFRAYETQRLGRVSRVQKDSARMGDIYHMSGALRLARNLTLAATPGHRLLARNDWLYRYRVEELKMEAD
ncbi:MAG TPA: FAD-dependent monooxygenase [Hyphomicrobiales bacterium]|jgi:salicylate hydroxylase